MAETKKVGRVAGLHVQNTKRVDQERAFVASIRVDRDQYEDWKKAARLLDVSVRGFVVMLANYYARRVLGKHWDQPSNERIRSALERLEGKDLIERTKDSGLDPKQWR